MRLRPSKAPLRSCMAAIPSDGLFLFLTEEEEWPETSKEDCLCLEDGGVEPSRELNGVEDNDGHVVTTSTGGTLELYLVPLV
jgi:hypothetical protein